MITILNTKITTDIMDQDLARHVDISITEGQNTFLWRVGGLPLVGDLQLILDARESEFWVAASAKAEPVPAEMSAKYEARLFMTNNPNAKLLIELGLDDLLLAIRDRTANEETLLLKTLAVAVRFLYEQAKLKDVT